jgi:sugar phosphate isomerase/epimerase
MFKSGVVSVSFRPNSVEEIIKAAKEAELSYVEWGSDVHCTAGDVELAKKIKSASEENGLKTYSYGSYFRVGVTPNEEFYKYLDSAKALGSDIIRIWGYKRDIPECKGGEWDALVSDAKAICKMAEPYGIKICLECHNGSITENYKTALAFLKAVDHPLFRMYWQPNQLKSLEYNLEAASALSEYIECIHTFHFIDNEKAPLEMGVFDWKQYLAIIKEKTENRDIPMLLEFMPDDKIETLKREAKTLNSIIADFV